MRAEAREKTKRVLKLQVSFAKEPYKKAKEPYKLVFLEDKEECV